MHAPLPVLLGLCCLLGTSPARLEAAEHSPFDPRPDGSTGIRLRIEVGGAYRAFGGVTFRGGSFSPDSTLPQLVTSSSDNEPYGPRFGFANRIYDNGFVLLDSLTNGTAPITIANFGRAGTTARWSGPKAGFLVGPITNGFGVAGVRRAIFHGEGEISSFSETEEAHSSGSGAAPDVESATPYLRLAASVPAGAHCEVGAALGFIFASISGEQSGSPFQARQLSQGVSTRVSDEYLPSLGDVLFAPGDSFFYPARLLVAVPKTRTITTTPFERSAEFSSNVHENSDFDLYTLSLGPTFDYHCGRLMTSLSTGLAVNIANWEAQFDERLIAGTSGSGRQTIRHWHRESSGVTLLPGFFLQTSIGFQLCRPWSVSIFARYDWNKALDEQVGPSSFHADLDGLTVGSALTFTF